MKIEKQVLSIEQMKHLQELGVDTSDASMCWVAEGYAYTDEGQWELCIPNNFLMPYNIPTYTIGDLIEKLPDSNSDYEFQVKIKNHFTESIFKENKVMEDYVTSRNPIDALYMTLCLVAKYYPELLEAKK